MLLVYLSNDTTRTKYIFDLVFNWQLGIEYKTTSDLDIFNAHSEEKINYSSSKRSDEFFIKSSSLLFENFIQNQSISVEEKFETKVLFSNSSECDLGFDIFSAIFYMISRYEEYLPFVADEHERFKVKDSLAYKNNFLQIPVIDIWISHFKIALQERFPKLLLKSSTFKAIVTYDIDVAYKFKGRNFIRNTGSIVKDILKLDFKNIRNRLFMFQNKQKDPWDVYDYLKETIIQNNLQSVFFFLLGDYSKNDRNINHKNPLLQTLINKIKTFSEIGIHPSYNSSSNANKILSEKKRLENILGKMIYKSRQHFLKFTLPDTYNSLLSAGIKEDYSMGFPDEPGFRAGTCKPFYFYDLKNEKITDLTIFPSTVMEGAYIKSNTNPEQALENIFNLVEEVKKVNGTFISIWHNHTVSETSEFKEW
ncbi:MAG: polysaccharide deacetylase family protein, partial [Ginsengibacter sp.]